MLDGRVEVLFELDRYLENVGFEVLDVVPGPGGSSMQHFVKNDAQTPDVALVIEIFAGEYFRCSVERSAEETEFLGFGGIFNDSAKAEVAEFGHSLLE